jgi:hypothetical protein
MRTRVSEKARQRRERNLKLMRERCQNVPRLRDPLRGASLQTIERSPILRQLRQMEKLLISISKCLHDLFHEGPFGSCEEDSCRDVRGMVTRNREFL